MSKQQTIKHNAYQIARYVFAATEGALFGGLLGALLGGVMGTMLWCFMRQQMLTLQGVTDVAHGMWIGLIDGIVAGLLLNLVWKIQHTRKHQPVTNPNDAN